MYTHNMYLNYLYFFFFFYGVYVCVYRIYSYVVSDANIAGESLAYANDI